ncbi:MAG TPA: hypothetical protein VL326_21840, partial [Kofleriaceae bacterium]|nr:hypothetical protein [Kofleriaceae bacterium]
ELGNNSNVESNVPVVVSGLGSGVQAIAAGYHHVCAIYGGTLRCWGANGYGDLGNSSTANSPVPVTVSGISAGAQGIAAGVNSTCALVDGAASCWGWNRSGQIGDGDLIESHVPAAVTGLSSGVDSVDTSWGEHACANQGGTVMCWGSNSNGQLGNGTTVTAKTPIAVNAWAP